MNSRKTPFSFRAAPGNRGNAMIYVIICLVLLGGLTLALTRQADTESSDLSAEQADLAATKMIAYAGSVKTVVDQMMMSGTPVNALDLTAPGEAGFDTPPYIHKIFHPSGGGLTMEAAASPNFEGLSANPKAGWYLGKFSNIEWTPTTAQDVILTAYRINKSVCAAINKKITGSSAIPAIGGSGELDDYFIKTTPNYDLTETVCSACKGYPSLCVHNAGGKNAFYSIILGQ